MAEPVKVLTIAGSDSGGAAGLQADIRTFAALGAYGMSVVTAVTAQNSVRVDAVHPLPADFVAAQLDAVLSDYGAAAVKTGFVGRIDLIATLAARLRHHALPHVVVDPVLVNHRGAAMFPPDVTLAYIRHLFPLAELVTPNRQEAALLTGLLVEEVAAMETAARHIHSLGPSAVLIKGGRERGEVVDVFYDGAAIVHLRGPWLDTSNTHGSGDTLSAAAAVFLAQGQSVQTAVQAAQAFTAVAIRRAAGWQLGQGHGPVAQWLVGQR
jgi:hydroxymethylpyrimidine/phosphomethylpyrimidine kinase